MVVENRREFMKSALAAAAGPALAMGQTGTLEKPEEIRMPSIPLALVQFDALPEQVDRNLEEMARLTEQAVQAGARWVMFHEGTVCDYTPRLRELAEQVPQGKSTRFAVKLAARWNCFLSFGLSESHSDRYHISQVFVGPKGFIYRYDKTWIWHDPDDKGYRDEWMRYDPGTGPEIFQFDGIRATCFICADGEARRCLERAAQLRPQLVFYPNNRASLPEFELFGQRAKLIGAPMLVTNRVGYSWVHRCLGGCAVYSREGEVLAKANREGREEILLYGLKI